MKTNSCGFNGTLLYEVPKLSTKPQLITYVILYTAIQTHAVKTLHASRYNPSIGLFLNTITLMQLWNSGTNQLILMLLIQQKKLRKYKINVKRFYFKNSKTMDQSFETPAPTTAGTDIFKLHMMVINRIRVSGSMPRSPNNFSGLFPLAPTHVRALRKVSSFTVLLRYAKKKKLVKRNNVLKLKFKDFPNEVCLSMPMFLLHTVEQISRKLHIPFPQISVLCCVSPINWLFLAIASMQLLLSFTRTAHSPAYLPSSKIVYFLQQASISYQPGILIVSDPLPSSPSPFLTHIGHTKFCTYIMSSHRSSRTSINTPPLFS